MNEIFDSRLPREAEDIMSPGIHGHTTHLSVTFPSLLHIECTWNDAHEATSRES